MVPTANRTPKKIDIFLKKSINLLFFCKDAWCIAPIERDETFETFPIACLDLNISLTHLPCPQSS